MNIGTILRAVQIHRNQGGTVTFESGWETRGNGYTLTPVGIILHHTATPSSLSNPFPSRRVLRDGRSNLAGPLCNSAGPADGSVHIVAAQAANHAGASGGRSMGPLPVTGLFNPKVWGHEIDYAGTVPMLAGQYRAAVLWSAALLQAMAEAGLIPWAYVERVRAHAETSITGKFDPGYALNRTIDMAVVRTDIARSLTGGFDMTTPQSVWTQPLNGTDAAGREVTFPAQSWLTYGNVYAGAAAADLQNKVIPALSAIREAVGAGGDTGVVDPVELADALANHATFLTALATALAPRLADVQDTRTRDSDPGTGPVT